jgi:phosphohistidine phosphatase
MGITGHTGSAQPRAKEGAPLRARQSDGAMDTQRQLFVLRHAKSSWDDPGLDDHERPLAPRGRHAVKLLSEHLRAEGIKPVQVLCSSSRRTRETLEGVRPGGETLIEPELYGASCEAVIQRLRRVPDEISSVMVIGHNPAMQMLVLRLTGANGSGPSAPAIDSNLADVQGKFPTGALATLTLDCAWDELAPGCAKLAAYVNPKRLH